MEKQLLMVRQFQDAFNAPLPAKPSLLDEKRKRLRQDLLEEEVKELSEANDLVDVADALMDILYITYGTLHEYGLADRAVMLFDEVHSSNMSKLGPDGQAIFREDGKVMKPETYRKPNLKLIVDRDFTMYSDNDVLAEIGKNHAEATAKLIENKVKSKLNMFDKFVLWISNLTEKRLKKVVTVKHPTNPLANIVVSVYGNDFDVK